MSQDTTHRYWRECDLCFSTHHLAIPAASSRDHLSSRCAQRPKAPACGTHSRFAWARTVHLTKNDHASSSQTDRDCTGPQRPVNGPAWFFSLFFGPRWHGQHPRSSGCRTSPTAQPNSIHRPFAFVKAIFSPSSPLPYTPPSAPEFAISARGRPPCPGTDKKRFLGQ